MRRGALGLRLAVAFAAVAALTAALAAILLTTVWDRQFEDYVRQNIQVRADEVAGVFAGVHAQTGGWDSVRYADLAHLGITMSGFRVRLYDEHGALIGDSAGSAGVPVDSPLTDEGESPVAVAPVMAGERRVGEVHVTSLHPGGFLTERDVQFRRGALLGLLAAAILAVAGASVAGALFARGVVRPIERVTAVAARMREGELGARTGMTGEGPIEELAATLDSMAESIEAEREFERRLTADVAHEIRTPLQAIQATVEAMQDGVLPADPERLGIVREETTRLGRLADSILELSRLETGAAAMRHERLDLSDMVAVSLETHGALMESAGLEMSGEIEPGLWVVGDRDRLAQALGNLLSNAARYTPAAGSVRVRLVSERGTALLTVRDSGMGIASDDLGKVFTRFWRADPARGRSKGGAGIGLAVVREIVERHEGTVRAESGDWGTEFALRLPLAR